MDNSIITQEDCLKILEEKYKSKDASLISFKISPYSNDVAGFMGEHNLLEISCRYYNSILKNTFFVKSKPQKLNQENEIYEKVNYFKKETYFYNTLLKNFEKNGIYVQNLAPKCYYCTSNETLVLENMKEKKYFLKNRHISFDLNECKKVLETLANFHGSSLVYEEKMSKKLGKLFRLDESAPEIFVEDYYTTDLDKPGPKYFKVTMKSLIEISKLLPKDEIWKNKFKTKMEKFNIQEIFHKEFNSRKTIGHGDLWTNNILFLKNTKELFKNSQNEEKKNQNSEDSKNNINSAIFIDFQSLRYFYPIFDFLLIIFTNTEKNFREKYFDELLNFYFKQLYKFLEAFKVKGEEILTKSECMPLIENLKAVALIQASADRSFTLLPLDFTEDNPDLGDHLQDMIFTDHRIGIVTSAFKNCDRYRAVMSDYILEIDESLV